MKCVLKFLIIELYVFIIAYPLQIYCRNVAIFSLRSDRGFCLDYF